MTDITLLNSSGVKKVDSLVCDIINVLEQSFPDRIRGYYLEGSYADNSAVATSDIDMRVVFKSSLDAEERQQFAQLLDSYQQICPIELGITADSEEALFRIGAIRFQKASVLMYGEDIRSLVPLKPIEDYIRDNMHFPYRLFARVRGNREMLTFRLEYPDPADEFYGYAYHRIRSFDEAIYCGTKDLVLNVLCPATALIALTAGQYVVTKRECVTQYRRWINDEWTDLVEAVYEICRNQWAYLIPQTSAQRQQLRAMCDRTLAFENYFLERYKMYLLAELQQPSNMCQRYTIKRLGQIIYRERAVLEALQALKNTNSKEIQLEVDTTLQLYAFL